MDAYDYCACGYKGCMYAHTREPRRSLVYLIGPRNNASTAMSRPLGSHLSFVHYQPSRNVLQRFQIGSDMYNLTYNLPTRFHSFIIRNVQR